MQIERVECIPFTLPLTHPVRYAGGVLAVTEHVLVQLHTDEGLVGRAEAPSRPFFYGESQASMMAAVRQWFGPMLVGRNPFEIEGLWAGLAGVEFNHTIKGALDIALHDLMGQIVQQPCYRLLGAYTDKIRVTYICGYADPQAMADEALIMQERHGISSFKLKVGIDPVQDVKMLHVLRRALPDALLYVDGNSGLSGPDAVRVLDAGYEIGLAWAEEPVRREDRCGRKFAARHSKVPILGDESCRSPDEVVREIDDGIVQAVIVKTARSGFRVARDILAICTSKGVRTVIGSQGDSTLGIAAALHFAVAHRATAIHPAELSFHLNTEADILVEPMTIRQGCLNVPQGHGLGVHIDPEKLARYRVN
jgi:L-Ala-D/L-Glu epimerase